MTKYNTRIMAFITTISIISLNCDRWINSDYVSDNNDIGVKPNIQWSKTYGYNLADSAQSIDQASDNGYVVAGYSFSKGGGNNDIWVFKLDSAGKLLWEQFYGSTDSNDPDYAYSVKATPDGGCVFAGESRLYDIRDEDFINSTPSYKFTMYIAKMDAYGNREWKQRFGGTDYDRANSITTTKDGGYIVGGHTQSFADGYIPPPHNKKDVWIIKLTKTGRKEWEVIHGGPQADGINSIYATQDGGYVAAGFTASWGAGSYDFLVLKLNSTGTIQWQRTYGGTKPDIANSIVQTSDGGYIVAGETWSFGAGQTDFYVVKLTADGTVEWSNTYGGAKFERASSIRQTPDGGYIVVGYTSSFGAGNKDFWIVRIDSKGTMLWSQTVGGASCDEANSIALTNDGGFIVAGNTSSWGAGDIDALIIKYDKTK